jgi:hypothetical protein
MADNPLTTLLPLAVATLAKNMASNDAKVSVQAANSVLDRIPETQSGGGAPVVQAAVFVQGGDQASEMVNALVGFLGKLDGPEPVKVERDVTPIIVEEPAVPVAAKKPKPKKKPVKTKPVPKYVVEEDEAEDIDARITRELEGFV